MRLLVLGAGGVIGSAVARESVTRGHDVHGLLRPSTSAERLHACNDILTCHRHDLEDIAALSALIGRIEPQAIVHAAFPAGHARTHETRLQMLQHGLTGSLSLLEALSRARSRANLVYLGSAISYGATGIPHHPSHRLQPGAFRGVVKAAESLMIGQYGWENGGSITELRLFSVYGPWEQREKLVPRLLAAALGGGRVPLSAEPRLRDWVYLDDVVAASLRACERTAPGMVIFNVCSGRLYSNHDVARAVESISGREVIGASTYPDPDAYGDPQPLGVPPKPEEGLIWRAQHDLQSGLKAYWAWATSEAGRRYLLHGGGSAV
jgi:nucleoside-diphosphate-sugar epimerase